MVYLGIDYGDKKIGLAISDENAEYADSLKVIANNKILINALKEAITDYKVQAVVLGISYNFQNLPTQQTKKILGFKKVLEKELALPVNLWDESYSSKRSEMGKTIKQKAKADSMAAKIILQEFLDFKNTKL